jgi:hypothetical protein
MSPVDKGRVLDRFLYDDENNVDRLYRSPKGRTLRHETTQTRITYDMQMNHAQGNSVGLKKERRDVAAVRRLEKEMDALTDPQLLRNARRDQDRKSVSQ